MSIRYGWHDWKERVFNQRGFRIFQGEMEVPWPAFFIEIAVLSFSEELDQHLWQYL